MAFLSGWRARHALCTGFAILCVLLLLASASQAQEAPLTSREKELKVAFLYNFALYTEWPGLQSDGLTLCVLGRDDLGTTLDVVASRQINNKPITVRRLELPANLTGCHMVYIPSASHVQTSTVLKDLRQKPILSVKDGASSDYATINLDREGSRLVFDINNSNARNVGLTLSSKLLRLARSVD